MSLITDITPSGGVQVDLLFDEYAYGTMSLTKTTSQLQSMLQGYSFLLVSLGYSDDVGSGQYYVGSGLVLASTVTKLSGTNATLYINIMYSSGSYYSHVYLYPANSTDTIKYVGAGNVGSNHVYFYGVKI